MIKKIIFGLFISLLLMTSCQNTHTGRTIKLAHGLDITHPVHLGMEYMAKLVAEKSNGELKIDIYPSRQLGSERQCLELLQIGSLDMTKVSSAVIEGFAPKYKVLGLPYIFRDKAHAHKVLDGDIGKELLNDGSKFWLRGLTFFDAGSRSFYTIDRPVHTPQDLEGLKIRVMKSITAMNLVSAMGGSPTPISWGELYTALQSGVVDGAENNPPSFYTSHHYEVCKYYSINEHTAVPDVLLISTHLWDKLSEQEQEWLMLAANEAKVYQRKLWEESVKKSLEEVQKAGVEIIYPDKKPFEDIVQEMYLEYSENDEIGSLIKRIKEVK